MLIPKPNISQPSSNDNLIPQVPLSNMIQPPRVDFDRSRFDQIIAQKGVDVLIEKALQCPCKTEKINTLSTCKNCGGTGWVFVNPRNSRLVMQNMGFKNVEDVWSKLVHGLVTISYTPEEKFAFMDRVTRLKSESIFSETIEFKEFSNKIYGFTTYQPKDVEYVGLYISDDDPFLQITPDQFKFINNRIELKNGIDLPTFGDHIPLTATIRYVHAPTFNILEIQREPVENFKWNGKGESDQELPGKAIGRRTHNIDDLTKLRQGKLNENNYQENNCK